MNRLSRLSLVVSSLAIAHVANGATILFDFGPTVTPGNWNIVPSYTAGVYITSAVDTNGTPTGMELAIVSNFSQSSSTEGITGGAIYPDTASGDCLRNQLLGSHAEIMLSGLNPAWYYSFTFYPASFRDPERITLYSIGSSSVQLEAAHNYSNTACIESVQPNASGEILMEFDNLDYWSYINVLQVDAIPEPCAALLVIAGLAALRSCRPTI
jgi:hypothetical protein